VISTSDLKRGAMMELDGQIVQIMSFEHQKIGRGSAQVRLKVKNIRNGAIFETTAQAGSITSRMAWSSNCSCTRRSQSASKCR